MRIGVPKEIMNNENRVALTPLAVQTLSKRRTRGAGGNRRWRGRFLP